MIDAHPHTSEPYPFPIIRALRHADSGRGVRAWGARGDLRGDGGDREEERLQVRPPPSLRGLPGRQEPARPELHGGTAEIQDNEQVRSLNA